MTFSSPSITTVVSKIIGVVFGDDPLARYATIHVFIFLWFGQRRRWIHGLEPRISSRGRERHRPCPTSQAPCSLWLSSHYVLTTKATEEPNRIGEKCTGADIVVSQGPTAPLSSGIPTYTVQIMNMCSTGCDISGIHLNCGWFSSARLIDPKIFKRLRYNDCLVNDGKPLVTGGTLTFQYANTFSYPLAVSSIVCH
ncbi:PROTEIN TAPETUM DETERMINANT 1 [Salix koriyanagi]|uniref:PROTEIN TAPETUM DETERMINANT 1 n=1 Tax=Salix koriyanagi TaxID=2511006 RepID=A0A9Q0STD5_9ROSI|nr:PROTEIN TAPETUM DETERMINANT 1 [Salix koriyanagi]